MTLSDLASLGSFVSGLAVLVSLIFLYFQLRQLNQQVRQAEKNQQASISQARSTRTVEITLSAMQAAAASDELAAGFQKVLRGEEDVPVHSLLSVFWYWRANFHSWQDAFDQHTDGLLTESAFDAFRLGVREAVKLFGARSMWRLQRQTFGASFVAWMDKLIAETSIEGVSLPDRWRNAVRAERSGAPY
jgi:hypothetical protein